MPHRGHDPFHEVLLDLAEDARPVDDGLAAVGRRMGGGAVVAFTLDPEMARHGTVGASGLDPALTARMGSEFGVPESNPTLRYLPNARAGRLLHRGPWLDWGALRSSAFYERFWLPSGTGPEAGGMRLPVEGFGDLLLYVGRPAGRDWLDGEAHRRAEADLAQVGRALRLRLMLLGCRQAAARGGEMAVIVLDRSMRVLSRAGGADALIADGDLLRTGEGRARWAPAVADRMTRAFAAAGAGGVRVPLLLRDRLTMVDLAPGPALPGRPTIVLSATRPRPAEWDAATLAEAYGLTAREAEVTLALLGGAAPEAIARRHGLRPASVRTYLKAVYSKTGLAGQVAVMAHLSGMGAASPGPAAPADRDA